MGDPVIVYKLVRESRSWEKQRWHSLYANGYLSTYYELDQWIKPVIGKLFCFERSDVAILYAKNMRSRTHYWVLKCEVLDIERPPDSIPVLEFFAFESASPFPLLNYWTNPNQFIDRYKDKVMQPPVHTVLCTTVKPIDVYDVIYGNRSLKTVPQLARLRKDRKEWEKLSAT